MPSPLRIQEPLPLRCGAVLPNRLAKAALSEALADFHNDVSEGLINLYRRWAESGAGLLIGGHTAIDRLHMEHAANVVLDDSTDLIGMGRPFILDTDFPRRMLAGSLSQAPAWERDFADPSELPTGAVLNWFCHRLTEQGRKDSVDSQLPVLAGHEAYLACKEEAARRWQAARRAPLQGSDAG